MTDYQRQMVVQGDTYSGIITVLQGEVPAIRCHGNETVNTMVAVAVNFLRAGCPAVQLFGPYSGTVLQLLKKKAIAGETFEDLPIDEGASFVTVVRKQ